MENVEKLQKNSRKRGEFESLTIGIFTQQEMLIFQHQSWYIYPSPEKCGVNPTDPGHILMIVHHISSYGDMKTWPTFTEYHQLSQKVMISIVPYYISKFKIKRITAYNTYSWTAHGGSVPYPHSGLSSRKQSRDNGVLCVPDHLQCASFWRFQAKKAIPFGNFPTEKLIIDRIFIDEIPNLTSI